MSKINETNYPRRTQASYEDTDMLVIQEAGGNTYTTRIEDLREDCQETLAPALNTMRENLATVEGSTASKAYAKGDFLVFGGRLCKAKTSIASGATLVLDTNIELDSVGDELSSISSDLASLPISRFSLNSSNPFRFYISSYGTALILAFVSGIGAVGILTTKQGNSVSSKSLADGNTWSFAQFDIHIYSGDNKYIEITSNSASYSTGTVITGF